MRAGSKRAQEGMTLIEVLVALLILSVGLLGAAAIQLNALKYTDSCADDQSGQFYRLRPDGPHSRQLRADYTVTPPTSGNLGVTRDQDLYDFTANIVKFARRHRDGQRHRQPAGVHHHHYLGRLAGGEYCRFAAQFRLDQSRGRRSGGDAMKHRSRGFGLIELLIALALSLIVVLGVVQVFIAAKNTYRQPERAPRTCRKMHVSC